MRNAFDIIITRYGDYFADSGFGLLFAVCLLFLILWKKDRAVHNALFWPAAVLALVVFCPVSGYVIMKLDEASVYWRVYWLLPVVLLAAFAATKLVYLAKGRGKQILLGLVCIAIVAVNGTFVFSDTYFEKKENNYKLPTEVIWVADAINEHAKENRIKKKKIVTPSELAVYIRIYDATIQQRYGRNMVNIPGNQTKLYTQVNAEHPDFDILAEGVRKAKSRYVVLNHEADNEVAMEGFNFEKIYESPSYDVYFNLRYKKKAK